MGKPDCWQVSEMTKSSQNRFFGFLRTSRCETHAPAAGAIGLQLNSTSPGRPPYWKISTQRSLLLNNSQTDGTVYDKCVILGQWRERVRSTYMSQVIAERPIENCAQASSVRHRPELDALSFFAFLSVFLFHACR